MVEKLTNQSKVQVVSLKLDKTKSRELAFRKFLDTNNEKGINRKESILRMYESMLEGKTLYNDVLQESNGVIEDNKDIDNSENLETLSIPKSTPQIKDWGGI